MDVEKQIMMLQDRVTDLGRCEVASKDSMTAPENDQPVKPKLSVKQKLLIAIALIAASAALVATTVMLGAFGLEADRRYQKTTGKPMSPDQRLVVDILGFTYFFLYFIGIWIGSHYHLIINNPPARMFWSFILMSVAFMAFVEVVHYWIMFLAAQHIAGLGVNV